LYVSVVVLLSGLLHTRLHFEMLVHRVFLGFRDDLFTESGAV